MVNQVSAVIPLNSTTIVKAAQLDGEQCEWKYGLQLLDRAFMYLKSAIQPKFSHLTSSTSSICRFIFVAIRQSYLLFELSSRDLAAFINA
jgi:hypothetical protein